MDRVSAADRRGSHPGFSVVARPPGARGRTLYLPMVMSIIRVSALPPLCFHCPRQALWLVNSLDLVCPTFPEIGCPIMGGMNDANRSEQE